MNEPTTVTVILTVDEARALFMECSCCAPPIPFMAARDTLYAALVEAGVFEGDQ